VTNVSITGNVGVGGMGQMTDSGPSTINGRIDFSAANTGQFRTIMGATSSRAGSFTNNGTSDVLTISGSASDLVAINLDGLGNIQFHGGIQAQAEQFGRLTRVAAVWFAPVLKVAGARIGSPQSLNFD
jgi:hypothetical protein